MLKVGITGNIGSGKTTISRMFELLGVPVFYADNEAKRVMITDEILIGELKNNFGRDAYFDDGKLNRKYIANIVFNDAEALTALNSLVHPAVFRAFDNWVVKFDTAPYIMKEAALLFESDSYKMCDKAIMVTAPLETRIARVMERDQITREEVENRNAKQFSEEKKIAMADYIIRNDNTELVIPQALALHKQFLALSKNR
jgi:dephospho-CoA kinase